MDVSESTVGHIHGPPVAKAGGPLRKYPGARQRWMDVKRVAAAERPMTTGGPLEIAYWV